MRNSIGDTILAARNKQPTHLVAKLGALAVTGRTIAARTQRIHFVAIQLALLQLELITPGQACILEIIYREHVGRLRCEAAQLWFVADWR